MENAAGRWEGKMKKPNWTWGDGLRASPTGQRLVHKIFHCQGGGDILCKSKTKTLSYLISIFNVRGLNMGPSAGEVPVGLIFSVFSELVAERDKQDCISLSAPRALHGRRAGAAQWERSGFQRRNGVMIKTHFAPSSISTESSHQIKSQGDEMSWIIFQI